MKEDRQIFDLEHRGGQLQITRVIEENNNIIKDIKANIKKLSIKKRGLNSPFTN